MSPRSDVRLFVIVPVYGNWSDTLDCLEMLASQTTRDFQVLIADDGSPQPAPPEIHAFPFAVYLRNEHCGFGKNCNRAAMIALERRATHLLFLNNDTAFSAHFIDAFIAAALDRPGAILSPMVYWFSAPSEVWYSGGPFTIWTPFFGMRRNYRETTEVDIVCGCAMLVAARTWAELDGFDSVYNTYFEDLDLCLRAKRKGIRTYVVAGESLKVRHKVGGSFRAVGAWPQQYLLLESGLIFIRRHYSGIRKWLCLGLSFARLSVVIVRNLPKLPDPRRLRESLRRGLQA